MIIYKQLLISKYNYMNNNMHTIAIFNPVPFTIPNTQPILKKYLPFIAVGLILVFILKK